MAIRPLTPVEERAVRAELVRESPAFRDHLVAASYVSDGVIVVDLAALTPDVDAATRRIREAMAIVPKERFEALAADIHHRFRAATVQGGQS
ncbi:MAG TPA: hypothetical protein VNF91_11115 [Candidatus Acidoferrum sp.]|nr:hypothetical protein [Candidatus Acidoferrum sp.]